jgi:hypothetical protein
MKLETLSFVLRLVQRLAACLSWSFAMPRYLRVDVVPYSSLRMHLDGDGNVKKLSGICIHSGVEKDCMDLRLLKPKWKPIKARRSVSIRTH